MKAEGVTLFGVTTDPNTEATRALQNSLGLTYRILSTGGDPTLLQVLKSTGLVDVYSTPVNGFPLGRGEPAVLAVEPEGLPGQAVFSWAQVPSIANMGGRSGRPLPQDIWARLRSHLGAAQNVETAQPIIAQNMRTQTAANVLCSIQ
mmetsp:Transcript_26072/g.58427  ORF Transcript_26072/g.58427 Transcript_26072/m.58427 type:complete len:147 (+) Transcript_26072:163-603(+)